MDAAVLSITPPLNESDGDTGWTRWTLPVTAVSDSAQPAEGAVLFLSEAPLSPRMVINICLFLPSNLLIFDGLSLSLSLSLTQTQTHTHTHTHTNIKRFKIRMLLEWRMRANSYLWIPSSFLKTKINEYLMFWLRTCVPFFFPCISTKFELFFPKKPLQGNRTEIMGPIKSIITVAFTNTFLKVRCWSYKPGNI